jgi:predicted GNAT superfamily acetyltransferase
VKWPITALATLPRTAVLDLNNAHAVELSWLDPGRLDAFLRTAFYAEAVGELDAFLIAFDEGAPYDSPNFLWFRERYERFVYVDRVVVAAAARGRGLARRLYDDLFARTAASGRDLVACEVNVEPPNPASDAFHAAQGFVELGRGAVGGGKTVRYLTRRVA